MLFEQSDAQVLRVIAARLLEDGRSAFFEAHAKGMGSFAAPTLEERLERLSAAIEEERRAIALQETAVELQRRSVEERRRQLAELKAALRW